MYVACIAYNLVDDICIVLFIIGERERANLVVSTADFSLYLYIYIFRALDATIP